MMVTSVLGPVPFPGSVTLRLWSVKVITPIPTASGRCGFGSGGAVRGGVLVAVAVCGVAVLACVGDG